MKNGKSIESGIYWLLITFAELISVILYTQSYECRKVEN